MKKTSRAIISLTFAATLLVPLSSTADTEGPYTYTVVNGQATITSFTKYYIGALSITNVLGGYPVSSISSNAFYKCTELTSVTIPTSVTTIGDSAFYYCYRLASVKIPGSVTAIGKAAFSSCHDLTNLVIGTGVKSIGDSAFYFCSNLTSVTIPASVTSIGNNAFYNCSGLTSVTIPNSVTTIGDSAFYYCSGLTSVTIHASITSIGNSAFYGCSGLTSVTIPNSVITIGSYAFRDCTSLTSVTIPNSVTTIGDSVFRSCSGLTSVTIPASVTSIGNNAFYGCTAMTNLSVASSNPAYASASGVLFNKVFTTLIQYPGGKTGTYAIPSSVTSVGAYAFYYCSGLTSVTIPASVTSIGYNAFYRCFNLPRILFQSTPPTLDGSSVFSSAPATLYYLPAFASNWPATLGGRPTLCWNPTVQSDASFGFTENRFGFNITGTANIPVRVEATTNLASPVWTTVTNTTIPTSGTLDFSDPSSDSQPSRFYRLSFPQ